ncbi:hypothetical protein [Bradyrhizobium sp. SEMIA]|uniref:hypothetical protein n=1 Tax=Bradyrhizobium sp. SEMIA TaxID=2597515 RepID=UPI0018A41BBF|nr:hypothetical protein [Bradyrhizobium sp. SEMIA]QOG19236.1 DDE-type integrase/transposase/recombinase [Bradyrhizobium sp. SEMIA]
MKLETMPLATPLSDKVTLPNEAWVIDSALLNFADRPFVMLVADVATRRPLSATLDHAVIEDLIATLQRLVAELGSPEQVWMDRGMWHHSPLLRDWAEQHGISLINSPMQTKSIAERMLRDLDTFLRGKRPSTATALGDNIERWRQSYGRRGD